MQFLWRSRSTVAWEIVWFGRLKLLSELLQTCRKVYKNAFQDLALLPPLPLKKLVILVEDFTLKFMVDMNLGAKLISLKYWILKILWVVF